MKKARTVKQKVMGRPRTGTTPLIGFRADGVTRAAITKWAENQHDQPTLSEAIRRLVELGLTVRAVQRPKSDNVKPRRDTKQRARELAGTAIDEMTDNTASRENQANRKRRLISGPEEFQSVRHDRNRK